ncbi:pre-mRNA-splicing factor CWC22 homolog [Procambarus clarkii]|uniref:pre-mRNA-splicing factor CWC22 homolog n=1 Tax=Procambarus clarkii TaxID=6728 RepID=UPI0037431665
MRRKQTGKTPHSSGFRTKIQERKRLRKLQRKQKKINRASFSSRFSNKISPTEGNFQTKIQKLQEYARAETSKLKRVKNRAQNMDSNTVRQEKEDEPILPISENEQTEGLKLSSSSSDRMALLQEYVKQEAGITNSGSTNEREDCTKAIAGHSQSQEKNLIKDKRKLKSLRKDQEMDMKEINKMAKLLGFKKPHQKKKVAPIFADEFGSLLDDIEEGTMNNAAMYKKEDVTYDSDEEFEKDMATVLGKNEEEQEEEINGKKADAQKELSKNDCQAIENRVKSEENEVFGENDNMDDSNNLSKKEGSVDEGREHNDDLDSEDDDLENGEYDSARNSDDLSENERTVNDGSEDENDLDGQEEDSVNGEEEGLENGEEEGSENGEEEGSENGDEGSENGEEEGSENGEYYSARSSDDLSEKEELDNEGSENENDFDGDEDDLENGTISDDMSDNDNSDGFAREKHDSFLDLDAVESDREESDSDKELFHDFRDDPELAFEAGCGYYSKPEILKNGQENDIDRYSSNSDDDEDLDGFVVGDDEVEYSSRSDELPSEFSDSSPIKRKGMVIASDDSGSDNIDGSGANKSGEESTSVDENVGLIPGRKKNKSKKNKKKMRFILPEVTEDESEAGSASKENRECDLSDSSLTKGEVSADDGDISKDGNESLILWTQKDKSKVTKSRKLKKRTKKTIGEVENTITPEDKDSYPVASTSQLLRKAKKRKQRALQTSSDEDDDICAQDRRRKKIKKRIPDNGLADTIVNKFESKPIKTVLEKQKSHNPDNPSASNKRKKRKFNLPAVTESEADSENRARGEKNPKTHSENISRMTSPCKSDSHEDTDDDSLSTGQFSEDEDVGEDQHNAEFGKDEVGAEFNEDDIITGFSEDDNEDNAQFSEDNDEDNVEFSEDNGEDDAKFSENNGEDDAQFSEDNGENDAKFSEDNGEDDAKFSENNGEDDAQFSEDNGEDDAQFSEDNGEDEAQFSEDNGEDDAQFSEDNGKDDAQFSEDNGEDEGNAEFRDNGSKDTDQHQEEVYLTEDIYGRLRDKDGNVVHDQNKDAGGNGKYVPPALRKLMALDTDEKKKEQLANIKKALKGLLNRLAESNMAGIASQIEGMYIKYSRKDMSDTLTDLLFEALVAPSLTPERLVQEHAMLVAVLSVNVGSEVGAHILNEFVIRWHDDMQRLVPGDSIGTKELDNVLLVIANLYNFRVVDALLVYDILHKLALGFSDKEVELILLVLRSVGFTLRKDDPLALKSLITKIQTRASAAQEINEADSEESSGYSRVCFMLEVLKAIRNNNMAKVPNYDPSHVEHLKKVLRGLVRKGTQAAALNVSLEDLLKARECGRWWIVGSAWSGDLPGEKPPPDHKSLKNVSQNIGLESEFSEQFKEKAAKLQLSRPPRINILYIITEGSEDYLDAFEKLLQLSLPHQQERELFSVILLCSQKSKEYNPFFAHLGDRMCKFDKKYKRLLQFALWDKFSEIESMKPREVANLAKFTSHLIGEDSVSLLVLKNVSFMEVESQMISFLRQTLIAVLLHPTGADAVERIFSVLCASPKLQILRQSLRIFIVKFLNSKKKRENANHQMLSKRIQDVIEILSRGGGVRL